MRVPGIRIQLEVLVPEVWDGQMEALFKTVDEFAENFAEQLKDKLEVEDVTIISAKLEKPQ